MIDIIIICFSDREFNNTFLIMNFHNTQLIQISVLINIFCKKKKKKIEPTVYELLIRY